ncbi:MAG: hypothetical protein A2Z02_03000, partial [Chloroflexi bacterium RBG_16_48_7]
MLMKKFFQRFSEISAVIFIFGFLAALVMFINLIMPLSFEERWKEVRIPEGSTYSQAIAILQSEGIINDRFVLLLLGRITMKDRKIRPGFYNLSASMTPLDIFDKLINGKAIHFTITIPEGDTLEDIRAKLIEVKLVNYESWKIISDRDFLVSLGITAPSLEGYLFPDTYIFAKGTEPATIMKMMVQRLRENFDEPMRQRASELGMCENDVLTLASIIETEAYLDEERPVISAVYHNRLKKKMRLQADPTAIYGIHSCLS